MRLLGLVLACTPSFPPKVAAGWVLASYQSHSLQSYRERYSKGLQDGIPIAQGSERTARARIRGVRVGRPYLASTADPNACSPDDSTPTAKPKTKRKKKQAEKTDPYWRNLTDVVYIDCPRTSEVDPPATPSCRQVRFKVRGNPMPLRRHRTSRGFIYNPSANAQNCFREIVQEMVFGTAPKMSPNMNPMFDNTTALAMTIVFRTKRPKSHFVASTPGRPLKKSAPQDSKPIRTDVDNLAKFVLDSLNGLLYADDHQISSLCVTKLLDNEDFCLGSTEVSLSVLPPNVSSLVLNCFGLYDS